MSNGKKGLEKKKKRYTYTLRGKAKKKAILAGIQQKQQRGQHYPAH